MSTVKRSEREVLKKIMALDLGPIKVKLLHNEDGESWTLEKVSEVEVGYRQFLYLNYKYPEREIVPTKPIDQFWHQHILDTRKYAEDCDQVFGHFLHHFPYFGLRGNKDAENLRDAFAETKEFYAKEFGVGLHIASEQSCSACGASSCGVADCGSSECTGISASSRINSSIRPNFADFVY